MRSALEVLRTGRTQDGARTPMRRGWVFGASVVLLVAAGLGARFYLIEAGMPYPRHPDEKATAKAASRTLRTGTFEPIQLNYPTGPTYIATAAMAAGYMRWAGTEAASQKIARRTPAFIGNVTYPFYEQVELMAWPRRVFAAISMLTLLLVIGIGRRCGATDGWNLLTTCALMIAPTYAQLSWEYLNVDVVGAFFVAAFFYALVRFQDDGVPSKAAAFLGVLVGLAAGCKYFHGALLFPAALFLLLQYRGRSLPLIGIAAVAAGLAFLATTPHAVLALPKLLQDFGYEIHHYGVKGHGRQTVDPGWAHLQALAADLANNFGVVGLAMFCVGIVSLTRDRRRLGLVAFSIFATYGIILSQQRVHFTRSLVPLFPLAAALLAVGMTAASQVLTRHLVRRWQIWARGVLTATFLMLLPWNAIARGHAPTVESRNEAAAWLNAHGVAGRLVFVDDALAFDNRTLPGAKVVVKRRKVILKEARRGSYLLVGSRGPALPPNMTVQATFGRSPVVWKRKQKVWPANPRLSVVRVD